MDADTIMSEMEAEKKLNEKRSEELATLRKIIPGLFKKMKNGTLQVKKGIDFKNRNLQELKEHLKNCFIREASIMHNYQNACETGDAEIRLTIKLDGYDIVLGEPLALVIIGHKTLLSDMLEQGWRVFW